MKENKLKLLTDALLKEEAVISEGGGEEGVLRQKRLNRLTVRDRLKHLLDPGSSFLELGLWAAFGMYQEWGNLPAAGVITGIGKVSGRSCLIIANDATVKAGAMFPQSVKKVLRAQKIAYECKLPVLYLVDSSGVFLPLQEDVFPDEDDFGRIFRNNSVLSALGIPQISAIMGNCIAGGGYLPVLSDKLLMTEGSGLYLAGPALVKAAIGQDVDTEDLGGAKMHSSISGTVDFLEPDDLSCLKKLRALVEFFPSDKDSLKVEKFSPSEREGKDVYEIMENGTGIGYDVREILKCIVDKGSMLEYKADFGKTLVTAYASIEGIKVGVVANQRVQTQNGKGAIEIGGVIYSEGADKAARFIMDCNQLKIPLVFIQDVMGFMVGKEAEQSGIIRAGAKLVNAMSNSIVPKITMVIGSSFGAGNYALCGKAYDPRFIFAWPNAKFAVMGADQAADTLFTVQKKAALRKGETIDKKLSDKMHADLRKKYEEQMDICYGAARGWVDMIIAPEHSRSTLAEMIRLSLRSPIEPLRFHTGVIQV